MSKPEWATAKVRFYLATCWYGGGDCPDVEGINWFHDKMLDACTLFHNWFVQPFFERDGFPFRVLEIYDGFDMSECEWVEK